MVKKILVVEDYDDARAMMRLRLIVEGYEVIEAANGKEAIELATRESPDLIIMDVSMPVLDGIETTRILKSLEDTKHIPIIALTAHIHNGFIKEKMEEVGIDEFLGKPANIEVLRGKIKQYIST
jgi:CheY-like chemotaxis protein